MPSQSFPGLILQGETLSILLRLATSVHEKSQKTPDPELIETSLELLESLQKLLSHFESTLSRHNIPLPYSTIPVRADETVK